MLLKSIIYAFIIFLMCFSVMFAFVFIATGFAPENCLLTTSSGDCTGIANMLPYSLRNILVVAIFVYSGFLAIKEGKSNYAENKLHKKNQQTLAKYRKK